jgi:hypothetical protein
VIFFRTQLCPVALQTTQNLISLSFLLAISHSTVQLFNLKITACTSIKILSILLFLDRSCRWCLENVQNLLAFGKGTWMSKSRITVKKTEIFVSSAVSSLIWIFVRAEFFSSEEDGFIHWKWSGTATVRRAQEFLDSVRDTRFFLLVNVQSGSDAKIVSYPYGTSGAISTSLKCCGLKTKFEHLQRNSTVWHHGCTESTMSSTSPVWHCTLPSSLLIRNLPSANSMVLTDISFDDTIFVDVQNKNVRSYFSDHISWSYGC